MNTSDIERILNNKCKSIFLGVFAKDRLPDRLPSKRPLLLVCNTDTHDKPGTHWIVLYVGENSRGEYFDSFAERPEKTFKRFLDVHCTSWIANELRLQSVLSKFCGHYCIFYCLFKCLDYDIQSITSCFVDDTALNDWIVHKFVCDSL